MFNPLSILNYFLQGKYTSQTTLIIWVKLDKNTKILHHKPEKAYVNLSQFSKETNYYLY